VEISYGDKSVNARSVLAVMSLGALAGATVVLRATGVDADQALTALAEILATVE
jgi:phosphotransferase system HPr (HPr) family protein